MDKTNEKNRGQARNSQGDKSRELAEEQKVHQDHLRRLRKYKKKHKQQVVGLVLELLLLVVVIGGYFAVSWTEGIIKNMTIETTTANPSAQTAAPRPTELPDNPSFVPGGSTTAMSETSVEVSWTNTEGQVFTDTMPPEEPYTNPLERRAVEAQEGYITIACFGVDARDSTTLLRNTQGDVCILVTINRENGDIRMASIYRDSLIEFSTGQFCKLTDAYARYGAQQVVAALNRNFDLNIVDFVVVNWTALADVVDLLGGLDIEVTGAEAYQLDRYIYETMLATGRETTQSFDYEPGVKHMDGVHVVAYSRIRKDVGNDYARTERQRKVIQILLDEIKGLVKGARIDKLMEIIRIVSLNVKTNMDSAAIMSLALNAGQYSIQETQGFPFSVHDVPPIYIICSDNFSKDVTKLHEYLYSLEDYEPSDNVKRIESYHYNVIQTGVVPGGHYDTH